MTLSTRERCALIMFATMVLIGLITLVANTGIMVILIIFWLFGTIMLVE